MHFDGPVRAAGILPVMFAGALLAACQSAPPPEQMSRTSLETAPADLQLLCANAAASSAGTDSSKVLPVGSRKIDAQNYVVDLNVNGKPTSCTVDAQGNVVSVTPTSAG